MPLVWVAKIITIVVVVVVVLLVAVLVIVGVLFILVAVSLDHLADGPLGLHHSWTDRRRRRRGLPVEARLSRRRRWHTTLVEGPS